MQNLLSAPLMMLRFASDFNLDASVMPMLVDPVEDGQPFDKWMAPWPIRFYAIHAHTARLLYCSEPKQATFDLSELVAILEAEGLSKGNQA